MFQLSTVGTAPGTTTLHIPPAMARSPSLRGLGTVIPTDFDMMAEREYLPWIYGWVPGTPVSEQPSGVAAQQQMQGLMLRQAQLGVLAAEEQVKTARSARIWTVVGGVVGVAGLVVSLIALKRGV